MKPKIDPWSDASFALEILFDAGILCAGLLVAWFGIRIQSHVIALFGSVFVASGICWFAADVWRVIRRK